MLEFACPSCKIDLSPPFTKNSKNRSSLVGLEGVFHSGIDFEQSFPFECRGCGFAFQAILESSGFRFSYPAYELLIVRKKQFVKYNLGQNNGYISYGLLSSASLSIEENEVNSSFRQFVQEQHLKSLPVLDIGCGPQDLPIYLSGLSNPLIGLDPFNSRFQGDFIQGTAEFLPIKSSIIGTAICATSIDHLYDLEIALREINRVLVSRGRLIIWDHAAHSNELNFKSFVHQMLIPVVTGKRRLKFVKKKYQIYDNGVVLPIPRGFSDPFHTPMSRRKDWPKVLRKKILDAGFREVLSLDSNGFSCWESE
jgi:SAM-dependent methyltransferase